MLAQEQADADALYRRALTALYEQNRVSAVHLLERVVREDPNHAGAWLDLGLLYCENGESQRAKDVFRTIKERFLLSESLADLLARYRESGCEPLRAPTLNASVFAGYASNPNAAPSASVIRFAETAPIQSLELSSQSRPKASEFSGATFLATGNPASEIRKHVDQWFFQINSKSYTRAHEYDTINLTAGLHKEFLCEASDAQVCIAPQTFVTLLANHWQLGERPYESSLRLSVEPRLHESWIGSTQRMQTFGFLSTAQQVVSANRIFDSRLYELGLRATLGGESLAALRALRFGGGRLQKFSVSGIAGAMADSARDTSRPGGDRVGGFLGVSGILYWGENRDRTEFLIRTSRAFDSLAYNQTFFGDEKRLDRRFFATINHSFALNFSRSNVPVVEGFFALRFDRNRSEIPIFSFKNQELVVGIRVGR